MKYSDVHNQPLQLYIRVNQVIYYDLQLEPITTYISVFLPTMIISIFNRKGSTGKTTTSMMVASILASAYKKKVALIDMDSQNDTKTTFHIPNNQLDRNIWNVLFEFDKLVGVRIHGNFIFINGSRNMESMRFYSEAIAKNKNPDYVLHSLLSRYQPERVTGAPDIIILDCPPSRDLIARNALIASDYVVVPAKPANMDINAAKEVVELVEEVRSNYNANCKILGIVLTQYDPRFTVHRTFKESLPEQFKSLAFNSVIRNNATMVEATSYSEDLGKFLVELESSKRKFIAYEDYLHLTNEIISRTYGK